MDKEQILEKLYLEKDIMTKIHRNIKAGLIGPLLHEYHQKVYHENNSHAITLPELPILRGVVDMLAATVVHNCAKDLIEAIAEIMADTNDPRPNTHCFYFGGPGCMNQRLT